MRVLGLVSACAVAAFETAPSWSFSGAWNPTGSNPTFTPIALYDDGSCYNRSSGSYYTELNHTFSTAGVRAINSFGINFVGVVANGSQYDLSNLCNHGSVHPLTQGSSGMSSVSSYGHWFEANVPYTFIFGSSSSSGTPYGAEFWEGVQGQTALRDGLNQGNRTWSPLISSSSGACYAGSSYASLYDSQVVNVNTTGYYNIFLAFARNPMSPSQVPASDPTFTILRGDLSGTDFGTITCSNVNFVAGTDGDALNAARFFLQLTANTNYTFVVSGGYIEDQAYYGHYSLTVATAMFVTFGSSLVTWTPPVKSSCATGLCATDSSFSPALPFGSLSFQVPAGSYFYFDATQPQDLEFYFYNGQYTPLSSCGGLASTCVIAYDSSDAITRFSPLSQWTVIAQAFYDTATFGSNMNTSVYIISGPNVNQVQTPTPTPAPSASGGTTSAPSTNSNSNSTSNSSAAPTPASNGTKSNSTSRPTPAGNSINGGVSINPGFGVLCALVGFFSL